MAGLRRKRADLFSYPEFALAAELNRRDFQFFSETRLIPGERGTAAFKRTAVIGGFLVAGVPLLTSARLAKSLAGRFNQADGEAPSGLSYLARNLSPDGIKLLPPQGADTNDFHYHRALSADSSSGYLPGVSLALDTTVEIIDRHVIMVSSASFPAGQIWGWIENWNSASDAEVVHASNKTSEQHREIDYAALQLAAENNSKNAVAKITVNLSIAIRNALDRLAAHRAGGTLLRAEAQ